MLVGLDSSGAADQALTEAIALADVHGGRLTILTTVPPVQVFAAGAAEAVAAAADMARDLEHEAVALQRAAAARVPQSIPVTTLLRHGSPFEALVRELKRGRHDVLILGASSRRRSWPRRRRLADRLISQAGVSVLVVGADSASGRVSRWAPARWLDRAGLHGGWRLS
jgi:nucleotide-binding universal stress UspA family protein